MGRLAEPGGHPRRRRPRCCARAARSPGRRVLVTAGGTREPLDPVRFLGNRSSGRMGVALADAALLRGAEVTTLLCNAAVRAGRRHRRRDADGRRPRARVARPGRRRRRRADGRRRRRLPAGRGRRRRSGRAPATGRSSSCPTADILAAIGAARAPGPGAGRLRAPRPATASSGPAQARAQGRRPDRAERRGARRHRLRGGRERGRAWSAPTARSTSRRRRRRRSRRHPRPHRDASWTAGNVPLAFRPWRSAPSSPTSGAASIASPCRSRGPSTTSTATRSPTRTAGRSSTPGSARRARPPAGATRTPTLGSPQVRRVVATHYHPDHNGATAALMERDRRGRVRAGPPRPRADVLRASSTRTGRRGSSST